MVIGLQLRNFRIRKLKFEVGVARPFGWFAPFVFLSEGKDGKTDSSFALDTCCLTAAWNNWGLLQAHI
jgi:hypothetical protein